MNKLYDFKRAKAIIEERKHEISLAYLGMKDDWYFTADSVFGHGTYDKNLDEIESIAGLAGSWKDTPTLRLHYKDGKEQAFDVYKEVSDETFHFIMGAVSKKVRKEAMDVMNEIIGMNKDD